MSHRITLVGSALAALLVCVDSSQAGAPGPAQRLYRVGSCGAGGPACVWRCASRQNPNCDNGETCELHPVQVATAHLVIEADDRPCGIIPGTTTKNGAVVTVKLAGRKPNGKPFKIPDRTIDLCGVDVQCAGCDESAGCAPTDPSCPRASVFLCDTDDHTLGERSLPTAEWLAEMQALPPGMAEDLSAEFDFVGVPVVVRPIQLLEEVDNSKSPEPSFKRFCIKIAFVPNGLSGGTPDFSGWTEVESASSLDRVDCPVGLCGDGVRDPGEECDDGNSERHDDCDENCRWRITPRSSVRRDRESPGATKRDRP